MPKPTGTPGKPNHPGGKPHEPSNHELLKTLLAALDQIQTKQYLLAAKQDQLAVALGRIETKLDASLAQSAQLQALADRAQATTGDLAASAHALGDVTAANQPK